MTKEKSGEIYKAFEWRSRHDLAELKDGIDHQYSFGFSGKKKLAGESQTNEDRVERASKAVMAWRGYEVADESNVRDLLSDLMHYCHKHGVNFEEQLGMARRRFLEEK